MALNLTTIAGKATVTRVNTRTSCIGIYRTEPFANEVTSKWDPTLKQWVFFMQTTVPSGLYGVLDADDPDMIHLYVGVNNALVPMTAATLVLDSGTGKNWDPLARFYDPLAS